jgi:LPS O-antigen subunit length determinant protein (WzzB/FepE family)
MRRALNALISVYPKSWRDRYENEFNALLDDVSPTLRTFFDVLGGALKMQMKIWSSWKIVPAFAVAGVLAAAVFSLSVPDRYVSTAVITIENGGPEGVGSIIQRMMSRSALVHLINDQGLYKGERSRAPLEDVVEQMKTRDIRIAPVKSMTGGPTTISISFAAEDAAKARRTTDGLVHLMEAILHAQAAAPGQTFALIDPPSLAVHVGPRRSRIIIMGVIAGILAGVLFALFNGLKMWKHAAMLGVAGAVVLGAASYLEPERYSSNAVLAYRPADQVLVGEAVKMVTSNASLHAIVVKFGLYPSIPRGEDELRDHLHVQDLQDSRAILIQFDYQDRWTVQRVTQTVVAQLIKENWNFEILDAPSLPLRPFFPDRSMAAGAGLVLGLGIATILGIKERLNKTPAEAVARS